MSRLIIVGIDGASPNLVNHLVAEGHMPHLQEIQRRGANGALMSTRHPITPSAWTSMLTGVGPGRHGIFDFRRRSYDSFDLELIKGGDRDGRTMWHMLSEAGHSVGVYNVPMTFPPEKVNGFWVSGLDTPHTGLAYTYPSALAQWLDQQTGGYVIEVGQGAPSEEEYLEKTLALHRIQQRAFEGLVDRYQPDAMMGVFTASDRLQHAFWQHVDPEGEAGGAPIAAAARDGLLHCYQQIDGVLGSLYEEYVVKQGAVLMVVSDHGFGPLHKDVYLNQWLLEQGYLAVKERHDDQAPKASLFDLIDWERTVAYSFGFFGSIYLNLEGREPLGTVRRGREQRQVMDRIQRDLAAWWVPEVEGPLVDGLYEMQDLYSGPYVEWGPDLLVVMQDYAVMTRDFFDLPQGILLSEPMLYQPRAIKHSGNHRMEGIVYLVGEGVAEGQALEGASILDVTPTALHLMGQAVPSYMEGRVLSEALDPAGPEVQYAQVRPAPSKAPTLYRLARQARVLEDRTARLQGTIERQDRHIAEQRRQLEQTESLWPVRLFRWLKRRLGR